MFSSLIDIFITLEIEIEYPSSIHEIWDEVLSLSYITMACSK
jgi:hypothetical protein